MEDNLITSRDAYNETRSLNLDEKRAETCRVFRK